ncbi:hypothetical protein [Halochromatium roseum]|nr:hypothetical protein [Halochromatium roseum]
MSMVSVFALLLVTLATIFGSSVRTQLSCAYILVRLEAIGLGVE